MRMLLGTWVPRTTRPARSKIGRADDAFTLIELMAVIAIVAILGAIALPALMRDDLSSRFKGAVRQLAQDLQRARYEALSSHESRSIDLLDLHHYELQAVVPGITPISRSLLARRQLETRIELYAVTLEAAHPDNTGATVPSPALGSADSSIPAEVQLTATSEVLARLGTPGATPPLAPSANATSVTIWLRASDGNHMLHRARVVLFQTTGFAKIYGESFDNSGSVVSQW